MQSQIRLLELASDALDDDLLGFHLARACELASSDRSITCWSLPKMLTEALHKAARYSSIVNEGVSIAIREGRETAIGFVMSMSSGAATGSISSSG